MIDIAKAAWRLFTVFLDIAAYCLAWGVLAWFLTHLVLELALG